MLLLVLTVLMFQLQSFQRVVLVLSVAPDGRFLEEELGTSTTAERSVKQADVVIAMFLLGASFSSPATTPARSYIQVDQR